MPRVTFVKKARKDYPEHGIERGDSYYWWKFRRGAKHVSKTRPRPSQLTQSSYRSGLLRIQEFIEDGIPTLSVKDIESPDKNTVSDFLDSVSGTLEEAHGMLDSLRDETEDKVNNLEDAFPNGCPTLDQCRERVEWLEGAMSELENAKSEIEGMEDTPVEDVEDSVRSAIEGLDWSGE